MDTMDLYQSTNFIVLSDHGLMKAEEEDQFYIEECLADYTKIQRMANSLAFAMVWPVEGEEVGNGQWQDPPKSEDHKGRKGGMELGGPTNKCNELLLPILDPLFSFPGYHFLRTQSVRPMGRRGRLRHGRGTAGQRVQKARDPGGVPLARVAADRPNCVDRPARGRAAHCELGEGMRRDNKGDGKGALWHGVGTVRRD